MSLLCQRGLLNYLACPVLIRVHVCDAVALGKPSFAEQGAFEIPFRNLKTRFKFALAMRHLFMATQ